MTENTLATENASVAEKPPENAAISGSSALTQEEIDRLSDGIIAAIKTVYDPEIPADIYELGLIYKIDIGEDRAVKIDMSLTSPNCPSAQELPIENAVPRFGLETKVAVRMGIRPGTRAGCPTRPGSSSTCGEWLNRRVMTMRPPGRDRSDASHDAAATRIKSILANADKPIAGVRVGVKNAGCAGMSYTMQYAETVAPTDEVVEDKGVKILVDPKAVLFLLGTEMDYKTEKLSAQFVFNNPNQTSACGCGESVALTPADGRGGRSARALGATMFIPACWNSVRKRRLLLWVPVFVGTNGSHAPWTPNISASFPLRFAPVTVRRMFGGAGIYADSVMFALVSDGAPVSQGRRDQRARFRARGPAALPISGENGSAP
jgi:iron-sulfur cluster assembly protein